jgi:hypothetical protein
MSQEAQIIARQVAVEAQKPEPPASAGLTAEQLGYWRSIVEDLPPGHIRSDNTPVMVELVRAMSISQQIAEALADLRDLRLAGAGKQATSDRTAFLQMTKQLREQTQLIAVLSQKLRFTNQSRDGSNGATNAARLRARSPFGSRPWEWSSGGSNDDDQGPPTY